MRKGETYYAANYDIETGKVSIEKYICRTIRKDVAYLIEVNEFTWGKRSKKHGDFGWRDPIWPGWRSRVTSNSEKRFTLTKSAAIRAALASSRKTRDWYAKEKMQEVVSECDAEIAAFSKALKRQR